VRSGALGVLLATALAAACKRAPPEPIAGRPPAPPVPATPAPAPAPLPGKPAPEALAREARKLVRDYLELCLGREEAAASRLITIDAPATPEIAGAVACDDVRGEAAMARVGDAIVARFGKESFRFTTPVLREQLLVPLDQAPVEEAAAELVLKTEWTGFLLRREGSGWRIARVASPQALASPGEAKARAAATWALADDTVRAVAAGQFESAQAAGRAFSRQLMALKRGER